MTCISESFHNYLRKMRRMVELPVTNMVVLTAVKNKPTPVRKQVMLEMRVRFRVIPTVFLVIPHLSKNLILGSDWLP